MVPPRAEGRPAFHDQLHTGVARGTAPHDVPLAALPRLFHPQGIGPEHARKADAAGAKYIISGDRHRLQLKSYKRIKILSAAEFLFSPAA